MGSNKSHSFINKNIICFPHHNLHAYTHKVEKTQISETYTIMSSKCQIDIINNNNIQHSLADIMPIFTTWPINTLGGNPFVKGSAIIRLVLIYSIDTLCF